MTVLRYIIVALLVPSIALGQVFFDELDVDNIKINGNTISTTDSNGNLIIDLDGTGKLELPDLGASSVPYLDSNKRLTSSSITPTELGYLSGVTSSLCGINQSCTLTGKTLTDPTIDNSLVLEEQGTTPSTPSSGYVKAYVKDDRKAYLLDSDGTERPLGSGASGSGDTNYLANPSFEDSDPDANWSLGVAHDANVTAQVYDGKQALCFTLNNFTGTLIDQKVDPPGDMSKVNLVGGFAVRTTMSNWKVGALRGIVVGGDVQNSLSVPADGAWTEIYPSFVGNGTDKVGARLYTDQIVSGTICVDKARVGPNRNVGTVKQANLILRAVRITSSQTVSSTSPTKIQFNSATIDLYGEFDSTTNFRWTAKAPRRVCAIAAVYLNSLGAGELALLSIYKNGSVLVNKFAPMNASGNGMVDFEKCFDVAQGDYLELYVNSSSDTSYTVQANPFTTFEIQEFPLESEQPAFVGQGADMLGQFTDSAFGSCPAGSLKADGTAVSRTTYAALFNKIGTTYGSGDGSSTFNLPDAQALVLRATGSRTVNGRTKTGPTNAGDVQEDQMQGHVHEVTDIILTGSGAQSGSGVQFTGTLSTSTPVSDGVNGTPRTGSETRVSAMGVTRCIYYVSQPMPLIKQAVTTPSDNMEQVFRASGNCSSSSSLTSTNAAGTTIGNISSGQCSLEIPPGVFSEIKTCIPSSAQHLLSAFTSWNAVINSSTSVTIGCKTITHGSSNVGNCNNVDFHLICMGPR